MLSYRDSSFLISEGLPQLLDLLLFLRHSPIGRSPPSFFLSCGEKFDPEEIHSDVSLWPQNPLILTTCNAVIMCDWRMKKRDRRKDKGGRERGGADERDKWTQLASRHSWLAPQPSPSISYNSRSRRVTLATLGIRPQPIRDPRVEQRGGDEEQGAAQED